MNPQPVPSDSFVVGDSIFADFKAFIDPTRSSTTRQCEAALKYLREAAEAEGYMTDSVSKQFKSPVPCCATTSTTTSTSNRDAIIDILDSELAARYYSDADRVRRQLSGDSALTEARAILLDPARYKALLQPDKHSCQTLAAPHLFIIKPALSPRSTSCENKVLIFTIALSLAAASGCVTQKKYNALQEQYTASQSARRKPLRRKSLGGLLEQCRRNNAELKEQYAALQRTLDQSIQTNQSGNVNISKLVDENQRVEQLHKETRRRQEQERLTPYGSQHTPHAFARHLRAERRRYKSSQRAWYTYRLPTICSSRPQLSD